MRTIHLAFFFWVFVVLATSHANADNPPTTLPEGDNEVAAARRKAFEARQKQEQDRNEAFWVAIKIMFAALQDKNPDIRVWLAEKLGDLAEKPKYARAFLEMMKIDKDERVRQAVKKSFERLDELEKEIQKNAAQSSK